MSDVSAGGGRQTPRGMHIFFAFGKGLSEKVTMDNDLFPTPADRPTPVKSDARENN